MWGQPGLFVFAVRDTESEKESMIENIRDVLYHKKGRMIINVLAMIKKQRPG